MYINIYNYERHRNIYSNEFYLLHPVFSFAQAKISVHLKWPPPLSFILPLNFMRWLPYVVKIQYHFS